MPSAVFSKIFPLFQTGENDVEVAEIWKSRRTKPTVRSSESPHNAFRRWRKSASLKLTSDSKGGNNEQKTAVNSKEKSVEEEMSLLKFLAIVSKIYILLEPTYMK